MLDSYSIDKLSIEIYENQFFISDFTPILVYLFRFSFLITLNIDIRIILRAVKGCASVAKFCSYKL